ncbi:hypothetical protein Dimus_008373 [Dionaea muscipula]
MGAGFSHLIPCFKPEEHQQHDHDHDYGDVNLRRSNNDSSAVDVVFPATEPLDETLGHSFCYVRSSSRFLSPTNSDRFLSPSNSLRFSPSHERSDPKTRPGAPETSFRTISGASVSANTSTPRTVLHLDSIYDDATESSGTGGFGGVGRSGSFVSGFESTSSFSALPLQPVPRGEPSCPIERSGFFLSGPIERGALSGPLDSSSAAADNGGVPFSAPLGGLYLKGKKRKKSFSGIKKALYRSLSEKKRPWVVPVWNFAGRKEVSGGGGAEMLRGESESNVQWALGKAGEDRVHVVVSEEHGWLFVGIYDGFNGPDGPEFLMGHLYRAVYNELKGLFWDNEDSNTTSSHTNPTTMEGPGQGSVGLASETVVVDDQNRVNREVVNDGEIQVEEGQPPDDPSYVKRVTFQSERKAVRRKLWEYLAEDDAEDGLDLSGSDRFAFSVDDAVSVGNAGSVVSRQSLLLSRLKQGLSRNKDVRIRKLSWRFGAQEKEKNETDDRIEESAPKSKKKTGPVDHNLVLSALSQALEKTELAYLDLTDKVIDRYPELALMGSCLLVVLMRNEDVYVMNVGDSRAIVAQLEIQEANSIVETKDLVEEGSCREGIFEENAATSLRSKNAANEAPAQTMKLTALQLSKDHSTSIEEEVLRIKNEHPDDGLCIVNDRVKGRLKVTRAFGAGFLKQPKWNDSLLEMFRNEFIGTAPYISCTPSLCHHKLGLKDQFLVLSSDGLYQYLTNQEVVSHVANFMEKFPDGDPAQHLIEELLSRAANKAGMAFHDLLDIPQGDRRKYHDDVTVMVVSLEGRIWKSSGKYP